MIPLFARSVLRAIDAQSATSLAAAVARRGLLMGAKRKGDVSVEALAPAIDRVSRDIDRALVEMQQCGVRHHVWTHGVEAAKAIASAPQRHMLGPRLVLLGSLHAHPHALTSNKVHSLHAHKDAHKQPVPHNPVVEEFAAGVELLHLFMLVQDDVMDHATVRRGAQTVHMSLLRSRGHTVDGTKAGHATTLISDVIHAKAMQMMANAASSLKAMPAFNTIMDASYHAAVAQFEDVVGWKAYEEVLTISPLPEDTMKQTLLAKCSTHKFSAPLQAGMQLTGASKELQDAAHAWGQHFGLAFQALDDLSDLVSDVGETGKDGMQDFREGRLSILLYLMRFYASEEEWNEALGLFKCMGIVTPPDRRFLFDIMERYKLPQHCLAFARSEIAKAEGAFKAFQHLEFLHGGITEFSHGLQHHATKLEERCKGMKK